MFLRYMEQASNGGLKWHNKHVSWDRKCNDENLSVCSSHYTSRRNARLLIRFEIRNEALNSILFRSLFEENNALYDYRLKSHLFDRDIYRNIADELSIR